MDIRIPEMDGLEATRRTLDEAAGGVGDVRAVILTTFAPDAYDDEARRAGASTFVLKDIPPAELAAAVRTVAEGEFASRSLCWTWMLVLAWPNERVRPARLPQNVLGKPRSKIRDR